MSDQQPSQNEVWIRNGEKFVMTARQGHLRDNESYRASS